MITANLSSSISVVDGYNITLSCTSSGSPPDTFTWMKDGILVTQSSDIATVTHTSSSAVFRIDFTISNLVSVIVEHTHVLCLILLEVIITPSLLVYVSYFGL